MLVAGGGGAALEVVGTGGAAADVVGGGTALEDGLGFSPGAGSPLVLLPPAIGAQTGTLLGSQSLIGGATRVVL